MLSLSAQTVHAEGENVTVYKTPWCGCCEAWSEALKQAGYSVKTIDLEDLDAVKQQAQVPDELQGCHTAIMGEYVLEGHVPLAAIDKLLAEKPAIAGISTPGMPQGSLGMGNDPDASYHVVAFKNGKALADSFYVVGE
ncbi:DUF411 domain-containing protein [Polycladidibacter stylochi]|uniref:DUF411 domain-containing protein n=1 Tax=Polycladidibacter stylochi TaxID=1807766 RepID=UPI00138F4D3D|nr:DUF411 domain-containing protein [Pseudovibrio stylochi]